MGLDKLEDTGTSEQNTFVQNAWTRTTLSPRVLQWVKDITCPAKIDGYGRLWGGIEEVAGHRRRLRPSLSEAEMKRDVELVRQTLMHVEEREDSHGNRCVNLEIEGRSATNISNHIMFTNKFLIMKARDASDGEDLE